jgi:predicted HicB family RNase H-like nuclease
MSTKVPRTEKVTSRVTQEEHRRLTELADAEGRSLSNYLHWLIRARLQTETTKQPSTPTAVRS